MGYFEHLDLYAPPGGAIPGGEPQYPSSNYHPAELDKSSSRYSAIRGREQNLIDHYRNLGILTNKKNSIWLKNKLRNYYLRNTEQEFGPIEDKKKDEE